MASRPAPVGTLVSNRQASAQNGPTQPQSIALGHIGVNQPLAEGLARLNLLDLFADQDSGGNKDDSAGDRPSVASSETVTTDNTTTTRIVFEDGSTLVVDRTRTDNSVMTTSTRTDADGTASVVTKLVTQLDDNTIQTLVTSDKGTTTTTIALDSGTRTVDTVTSDGDHITFVQTRVADGLVGEYTLVQSDGDSGTLDYSLLESGDTSTLSVEGTTADGVLVDSTVIIDTDTRMVTITDMQGDVATYSLRNFHDQVQDLGLIGLIADVDTGYFG
ncbi:hypothetical protein CHU95_18800 [Niveispirillum lacus]|uniref:Uncharacterized protein n=1 Tax=Niveispirillum lacus TaxID=1981099 RepID=A0A255YWK5_9PROT|nr:hypothetical protein [Niveispirillum lacus]OYQ32800.1 hypothetical protein CHU95_18800 [Niveispirillum lacus]